MKLPFTTEQFFDVFAQYNTSVWPMQIVLYALAVLSVIFSLKKIKLSDKGISMILSFLWIWMGLSYHIIFFSNINKAAYVFGSLFMLQGLIFFFFGIIQNRFVFQFRSSIYTITGAVFILYSVVVYSLIGGHEYPRVPLFGVPCPTTIFTFGLLLWTEKRIPIYTMIVPVLWSGIGFSAAINFNVPQDYGLFVAGILGAVMLVYREKHSHSIVSQIK